ncbi:carbohydrate binding domain-containing protein [candidate division KSB1 bacterium]|nr:carbohydrate binding domain-containing protein [candidate division KSB1 bacterium]
MNGDFSNNKTGWDFSVKAPAQVTGSVVTGEYIVTITNGSTESCHVQLLQSGLFIENGKTYLISLDAYAEKPRKISLSVQLNSDPWTNYYTFRNINLNTTWKTFRTTFTMHNPTDSKARFLFDLGLSDIDVHFDNIRVALAEAPQAPFKRGVNFADWLENFRHISQMNFNRYTKKNFKEAKSLGCDHIRVPIDLFYMTGPAPDYLLNPLLFLILDQAIDWAEELELHLILGACRTQRFLFL